VIPHGVEIFIGVDSIDLRWGVSARATPPGSGISGMSDSRPEEVPHDCDRDIEAEGDPILA
jgi:hypothetical protein